MIIDQIDDLAVRTRQLFETGLQYRAAIGLLHDDLGIVGRVFNRFDDVVIERRERALP